MKPSTHIAIAAACASLAAAASTAYAGPLGGQSSQHEPVIGKISHHALKLSATFDERCHNGSLYYWDTFKRAKIARNGAFAVRGKKSVTFDDGYSNTERYRLSGTMSKAGVVRGTLRVQDSWYAPDGSLDDVCNSGNVHFQIRDAGILAGRASNGAPTVLKLRPTGTSIKSLLIPWTADCESGGSLWDTANMSGPLGTAGAFSSSVAMASFDWGDGQQARPHEWLDGYATKTLAVGEFRAKTSIVDGSAAEVDSCDTGSITFRLT